MQPVRPTYTVVGPSSMLTYTHTPIFTNVAKLPVAQAPSPFPQVDFQEAGLTYIPWSQPLTTISSLPSPGFPFTSEGSQLVPVPFSMSLATVVAHAETQTQFSEPQNASPKLQPQTQSSEHQAHSELQRLATGPPQGDTDLQTEPLDLELLEPPLDGDMEPPNPLEKLLEDPREDEEMAREDRYSSALFISDI